MKYSFRLSEDGDQKLAEMKEYLFAQKIIKEDTVTEVVKMGLMKLAKIIEFDRKSKVDQLEHAKRVDIIDESHE